MLDERFVFVGAAIGSLGSLSYLIATVRGRARPNRVTFFFWALAPLIAFAAELTEGVRIQSIMTLLVGLSPLAIFLASFVNPKAEWRLTRFDIGCGVLALLGTVLWALTRSGNLAILFSIAADGFAATRRHDVRGHGRYPREPVGPRGGGAAGSRPPRAASAESGGIRQRGSRPVGARGGRHLAAASR